MTVHADPVSFWAESNLQCNIVKEFRYGLPRRFRIIAVPNGRFKASATTVARLKREGLTPGVFDLLLLSNDGTFGSIEVKAEKGRLEAAQIEWSDWLAEGGADQAVVRSLEEAEAAVRAWGVPLRARVA